MVVWYFSAIRFSCNLGCMVNWDEEVDFMSWRLLEFQNLFSIDFKNTCWMCMPIIFSADQLHHENLNKSLIHCYNGKMIPLYFFKFSRKTIVINTIIFWIGDLLSKLTMSDIELMHICCLFPRVIENICYAWNMNMSLWHELFNLIFLGENNLMLVFGDYRRKFFCHLNFIGLRLSPKFKSIYISSIMRNWSHYNFTMLLNKIFNQ